MGETLLSKLQQEEKALDKNLCELREFMRSEKFFDIGGAIKLSIQNLEQSMLSNLNNYSIAVALLKNKMA